MCLLRRINQETNIFRRILKYSKKFTGVAIAVVASIILGGTILVPIQFGFAAESDNNPRAVTGEGEKATTINNFTTIVNNNFNCPASASNSQDATIGQSNAADGINNSTLNQSETATIQQSATATGSSQCSATPGGSQESPA